MRPMLPMTVDQSTLMKLIEDPRWATQQKVDGQRLFVAVESGKAASSWGRDGQSVTLHSALGQALGRAFPNGSFILDGELIRLSSQSSRYIIFDLPRAGSLITPEMPYAERLRALEHLATIARLEDNEALTVLPTATTFVDKVRMVRRIVSAKAEGVIARRLDRGYCEGRSTDLVRFKLVNTVDCVVKKLGVGGRKNMVLEVYDEHGNPVEIGHCTAANGDGPGVREGSVVTVRYLRLTKDGRLREPTLPFLRLDKKPEECTLDQLVYSNMSELIEVEA